MRNFTKFGIFIFCIVLLVISGYLYTYGNSFIEDDFMVVRTTDEIKYRYDTVNGYVGLDITLNTLVANSKDSRVITNNTNKLQDAINKVSDAGGGTVYLPSGTYYFGYGGMNSTSDAEDFAIKCRNNVHLKGAGVNENSSSYTVLKPVYNNPSGNGGMDMFYFNNYKDTGYGGRGITTSTVRDVSHIDASGNVVTWKNQTVYLINADFSDFVIDADEARGGIASQGGTYRTDGKGFMINLFANCDWKNVVVKNTDATGFGVDCPINSTIKNCKAINCGKAATTNDGGASGFGIGTGYSDNESLVIDNCVAINNKKFGFFFEHQARFSGDRYPATTSKGFVVSNSIAGGNLYDFGGLKAYDVTYENNKSVSGYSTYAVDGLRAINTSGNGGYTPLTFSGGKVKLNPARQIIYYSLYSTNSYAVNTSMFSTLNDVNDYKTEVKWAVDNGVIPVNNPTTYGVNSKVNRFDVVNILFAFRGRPGYMSVNTSTNDKNNAKSSISQIGYTDLTGSAYQDDLDAILWAYNNGLISKDTKFNPNSDCTRAQLVTMLYRLAGSPNVSGTIPFNDVSSSSWYYNAVLWGYNNGIIKGTDGGVFSPNDSITKLQLAIFLYRFKNAGVTSYSIKYNLIGGVANNNTSYNSMTSYTLKNPTRTGYTFLGWTGSNGINPTKVVTIPRGTTGNLSYTANWSPNLTNIFIKSMPRKMVYKIGDKLNTSGLIIGAKYGDNNIKETTEYTISPLLLNKEGNQVISVNYGGLTTTFNVTVNSVDVSKIEISKKPTKLTYYVGENIDTSGMVLKVTYNDSTTKTVTSGFTVSPTSLKSVGEQDITIKYGMKSTSYSVTVKEVSLSKIEIKSMPSRLVYYVGEYIDTSGLVLIASYNNGTNKEITSGFTLDINKINNSGTQKVTVTYKKKTTSFTITVNEIKVQSIRVKETPKQINYFVGDKFSSSGLQIAVLMNSSYEEVITSGFSLSLEEGFKFENVGTVTIIVTYKDMKTSFDVNVCAKETDSVNVTNKPDQTSYVVGEEFDSDGLVLEYINSDGEVVNVDDYTLSLEDGKILDTAGTHTITANYNGKLTSFTIDVIKVSKLIINESRLKKNYKIGETFDSTNLLVIAEYTNGVKQELTDQYKVEVEGGEMFTSAGNKIVTISYGDAKSNIIVFVENAFAGGDDPNMFFLVVIAFIIGGWFAFMGLKDRFSAKRRVTAGSFFDE